MFNTHKKSLLLFVLTAVTCIGLVPVTNYIKSPATFDRDKAFNTDWLESYVNFFVLKAFSRSTNTDVIAGKAGFFFLGNKHNKVIYKTLDVYPYSASQINMWGESLLDLQQWYESKGIQFIFVIAPNKHSIYGEYLPDWIPVPDHNLTDQLTEVAKNNNINLLDLRSKLLESKKTNEELLYWKSDSHWNQLGASIGFQATIDQLNVYYNQLLMAPEFSQLTKPIGAQGGHARFLKIQNLLPHGYETDVYVTIEDEHAVCVGNIIRETGELKTCEMKSRPYLDIHKGPVYTLNSHALNQQKVLFLADSFSMQNSNLYNATFSTIWKDKYNHLVGQKLDHFVNHHRPDIVIYQVVERSIFNNLFIKIKP